MNANIVLDIETLDYLPAKTILKLVEISQKTAKSLRSFQSTVNQLGPLFRELEEMDIDVGFQTSEGWVLISFTGDGHRLGRIWGVLRRNGYKTNEHPKKGDSAFAAFWRREGYSDVFMNFSSSLCRRVQVGTQMVEQAIYETVCGDLPQAEVIQAPEVGLVVYADDIPF